MKPVTVHSTARAAMMALAMVAASSCGSELTRNSQSPAYLIVDQLLVASGPGSLTSGELNSDVITLVPKNTGVPTVFNDEGSVKFSLGLKNPGSFDATGALTPTTPSTLNQITLTRYHVRYIRADGRNREGVDIPYGFDGGLGGTVTASGATIAFELVRHSAKEEPPLVNLRTPSTNGLPGAGEISTIAEITFYGRDQAGNEVFTVATVSVNFGDFGDP